MPHAVIEYSRDLEASFDKLALMQAAHDAMLASGQFGEADVKIRLYPCHDALVGGVTAKFVHITVYMLSGRSPAIKKSITTNLLRVLEGLSLSAASLSVDARDLEREVYSKATG